MSNYYLCPRPFGDESRTHDLFGWAKETIEQGRTYLRLQPAYPYIKDGLDLINGDFCKAKTDTLSDVKTDLVLRNMKELIAAQSNIRVIPSFQTEIEDFRVQGVILNKTYMAWQTMTFADRAVRKAWQYASAGGTGYLGIRWEPNFWYRGKGDIVLDAYGPLDVMPIGLPRSHRLQAAYAVVIRVETPYHEVIRKFPQFIDKIRPSRESAKGRGVVSAAVKFASAALRKFGPGAIQENEAAPWAMVDVYHIYIDDDTVNNTGQEIFMGDPGTSWEYTVPYIGQEIHAGFDKQGNRTYRKAKHEDCLVYPNRRKILVTDDVVLNPDVTRQVNEYFHAKVPVVQFRADDWPWTYLGFPLTKAGMSLEKANIDMMRGVVDANNVRLSPPRSYDRGTMSDALAQTMNTRIPNQVVGLDMSYGKQMEPLLPPEYYSVPVLIPELIEANERRLTHQMGVADSQALARARQLPSGDSLDRMMEAMGPLIMDQSRNMEAGIRDLGEMWKHLVFQFYHSDRMMQLGGYSAITEEQFMFRVGDLVPDVVPGTLPEDPHFERARRHASNFVFSITPYSLHELNSLTRKMFYLQLMRAGFPIDWWTLAEVFDIKNFGKKPMVENPDDPGVKREANSILEAWLAQQEIMARFAAAHAAAGGPGPGGGGKPGGSTPGNAPPGGPPPSAPGHAMGRPPSGQNPPQLEVKSDGRGTIRESKR